MAKLCRHRLKICSQCIIVSDEAKRMSDCVNLHITCNPVWELNTKWLAFRLQDGTSDGALYDSREEAIHHQPYPDRCCFFTFRSAMGGVTPKDMQIWLEMERNASTARLALHEEKAPQLIIPASYYDWRRAVN